MSAIGLGTLKEIHNKYCRIIDSYCGESSDWINARVKLNEMILILRSQEVRRDDNFCFNFFVKECLLEQIEKEYDRISVIIKRKEIQEAANKAPKRFCPLCGESMKIAPYISHGKIVKGVVIYCTCANSQNKLEQIKGDNVIECIANFDKYLGLEKKQNGI